MPTKHSTPHHPHNTIIQALNTRTWTLTSSTIIPTHTTTIDLRSRLSHLPTCDFLTPLLAFLRYYCSTNTTDRGTSPSRGKEKHIPPLMTITTHEFLILLSHVEFYAIFLFEGVIGTLTIHEFLILLSEVEFYAIFLLRRLLELCYAGDSFEYFAITQLFLDSLAFMNVNIASPLSPRTTSLTDSFH